MNKMWKLFVGDIRRMTSNVATVIIVIGLVAVPSLFTWFNVAASRDPFGNVSNLKFAVANMDEGYKSDLIPVKMTVGDQVVNALRANSQLDWEIVGKDDAIDGVKSGEYYAAIVIPKSFSKDMMTFFSDDVEHAKLTYYRNEKKNALAPNILKEGADEVAAEINTTFASTITSTALDIASSLADQLSTPESKQRLQTFNANISDFAARLGSTADLLDTYGSLTVSAQQLLSSSKSLVAKASDAASQAHDDVTDAKQGISDITSAFSTSTAAVTDALQASTSGFDAVSDSIDQLYDDVDAGATTTAKGLRDQATAVNEQADHYRSIRQNLIDLGKQLGIADLLENSAIIHALDRSINRQVTLRDGLNSAADSVEQGNADAQDQRANAKELAAQAKDTAASVSDDYTTTIKPQIDKLASNITDISSTLDSSTAQLNTIMDDVSDTVDDAKDMLTNARTKLSNVSSKLRNASEELTSLSSKLGDALNSGDMSMVKEVLGGDTDSLAATLAAPVKLKRTAIFPVSNFGSQMVPLYALLSLWVGSLLMVVTLKTTVSRRIREELGDPKPHQLYLGHFGIFALISLLQSTMVFGGLLLFIKTQAVHPLLFMLCGWLSGLVYVFFAYTMVVSFGNVGKAIGVLMLIVQVSGANAAYPLQLLPGFISDLSPFLPVTHSVSALRAAIAGIYNMDYWHELGLLLAFIPPILLIGLVLRKPLVAFNQWYVSKVESTKLIS